MDIVRELSTGMPVKIRMRKPADMHQHVRQDAMLALVAPMVARRFAAFIAMPNTTPPITTYEAAKRYRQEISRATGGTSKPLMTMYLTDTLDPHELRVGIEADSVYGVKYYPPGLTTNSDSGVKNPNALWTKGTKPYEVLQELAAHNRVLLLHAADGKAAEDRWKGGENRIYWAGEELDPYDQELHFIEYTLPRIREAHPNLKISVEHVSTKWGADYVRKHGGTTLGCSLTAQHLLLDRRDSFKKGKQMGFNTHRFWWPIIQPKEHRDALQRLAIEGHSFVWLGSDSAPHPVGKKETDCCTGGVLMAHAGIELYAEAFEDMRALDHRFEQFASVNGPVFYGVASSEETIELVREEWKVEAMFYATPVERGYDPIPDERVVPFRLGETVRWKLVA